MSNLIGKKVEFKTIQMRRTNGRATPHIDTRLGKIKKVVKDYWVIIEGLKGDLYNRPVNDILILDVER